MKAPKIKGRRKEPPSPGGRALERLHQFEQERGMDPTIIESPEPDQSPAKKKKRQPPKTKKKSPR